MEKIFTTSELLQILSGKFRIDEEKENLPEVYIDQVLMKFAIDVSFITSTSDLSVISCENNLATLKKLVPGISLVTVGDYLREKEQKNISPLQINHDKRVVVAEDECTVKDFDMIHEKNLSRSCHHFRLTNKNLEWIASRGNVSELAVSKTEPKLIKQSKMFNSWNRINVISAEAGMGKSVMLKFMKNQYSSCSWVLTINLRSHFSFFTESQDPQEICRLIFQHHCNANRYNLFEESIAKVFLNNKKIAILLDGLDEIVDYEEISKVISAVRTLAECGFIIWISARRNLEAVLIKELCLFPLIIKQIDKEQQMTYATKRLNSKYGTDKTKQLVEKITNLLNTTKSSAILGVVLQIQILTDLLYHDSKKYSQFIDNDFTLTDMICYFIEETIDFNFNDKNDATSSNSFLNSTLKEHIKNKIEKYEIFSIKYFLLTEDFESLPQAKFLNKSDIAEDNLGIITCVKNTGVSYFSHNILPLVGLSKIFKIFQTWRIFFLNKVVAGQFATIRFGRGRRPRGPTFARGTIRSLFEDQEQATQRMAFDVRTRPPCRNPFRDAHFEIIQFVCAVSQFILSLSGPGSFFVYRFTFTFLPVSLSVSFQFHFRFSFVFLRFHF
jgi:hypothetical protein